MDVFSVQASELKSYLEELGFKAGVGIRQRCKKLNKSQVVEIVAAQQDVVVKLDNRLRKAAIYFKELETNKMGFIKK